MCIRRHLKLVFAALFLLAIKLETTSMPTSREPDKQQNPIKQLKWNELDLNASHIELKIA